MSLAIDAFIEDARGVSVGEAAAICGYQIRGQNFAGPCPQCGGRDRFSISLARQAWHCRGCGVGGRDGIGLLAHVQGLDVRRRSGFLTACSEVLGKAIPEDGERETEAERAERLARIAAAKARNAAASAGRDQSSNAWREREVNRARGIYLQAPARPGAALKEYLSRRTGFDMHEGVFANLRLIPNATYWHGTDERGNPVAHASGPCMVAPFVTFAARVTGCHQTWIDLGQPPKFKADFGLDADGKPLPAKKMRGTKGGSFLPLFGLMSATRWVGGEGIENGLSIAGAEGFRDDTFYFAAGSLGNLAGPADPSSAFTHPTLKKPDVNGVMRAVRVQGPVPKADQGPEEAMQVPDHVSDIVLLADGDSEAVFTAAAMARAEARLSREGRTIATWWAPEGSDFSELMGTRG